MDADAVGENRVIEIVGGMMTKRDVQLACRPCRQEPIGPGNCLLKIGKVFTAHNRRHLAVVLFPTDRSDYFTKQCIGRRVIAQHGVARMDDNLRRRPKCTGNGFRPFCNPPAGVFQYYFIKCAKCSPEHGLVGNDIIGGSGVELGYGNHDRSDRIGASRDNALQPRNHLTANVNRINSEVRSGGVSPFSLERDCKGGGSRHRGPRTQADLPNLRHIVKSEDRRNPRVLQRAFGSHPLATGSAFFGGLKNKRHWAGQFIAMGSQYLHGSEEHGGVTIVTTGMSNTRMFRGVSDSALLLHRKRVHVRPQGHRRAR